MELHSFLARLSGVRKSSGQYQARCPAHNDRNASLSVCERSGKLLIHCHAGCTAQEVVGAMGLSMRDLYTKPIERRWRW